MTGTFDLVLQATDLIPDSQVEAWAFTVILIVFFFMVVCLLLKDIGKNKEKKVLE